MGIEELHCLPFIIQHLKFILFDLCLNSNFLISIFTFPTFLAFYTEYHCNACFLLSLLGFGTETWAHKR